MSTENSIWIGIVIAVIGGLFDIDFFITVGLFYILYILFIDN